MGIVYKKNSAIFDEVAGPDEAEGLLEWLGRYPKGRIDLSSCTHLHPANLQVMMAANCSIKARPIDRDLAAWIDSALNTI